MMRAICTSVLLMSFLFDMEAQLYMDRDEAKQIQSLLSDENDLGGYGGFDLKVSEINGERAMLIGGQGGALVNHRFIFGLAGYGIATSVNFEGRVPGQSDQKELDLYGGYGGVLLGAIIAPKSLVHINVPLILGAGSMEISDENFFANTNDSDFTVDNSAFFVVEPGLEVEVNITPHVKIGLGGSYRLVRGADLLDITDNDLTNFAGNFSVKFGGF